MNGIKESHHDKAESQVEVHFVGQIEGSKFGFDNSYIHWFLTFTFFVIIIQKKDIQNQLGKRD